MHLRPKVTNGTSTPENRPPMFLHRVSSFSSSVRPRGHPALHRASSHHQPFAPHPHPWWSAPRFPPWPPRLPPPYPPPCPLFTGNRFHFVNAGGLQSFHTSVDVMMERPGREPPNKRLKSGEDRKSVGENVSSRDGGMRETRARARERESKQEQHHRDFRRDGELPANHQSRIGEKPKTRVERVYSRERTKCERRSSSDRTKNQHSQAAGSRTEQEKPNVWFRGRPAEEQRSLQQNQTGSAEPDKVGGVDAGRWAGLQHQPSSSIQADRRPPRQPPHPVNALQRYWETCSTEPQPPGGSRVFDFSVMSYNILSQDLLQDNAYLYRHCDPAVLSWPYRLPNLLAEIQQHDADILCLQEVQEDHYENEIKPALQALGYQCEYKKRTGKKPDGCAITFKSSRFSLVSSTPVEFHRRGDALLNRDNVGMVVVLQPNTGAAQSNASYSICVANTHLLYNPRRGDIKLAQLAILLAEIGRLSRLPDGSTNPVILCGDFNSVPWSPLYHFLTTGSLKYKGLQINMVSGQEAGSRGHRFLTPPIWSPRLGINQSCQYESKATEEPRPSSPAALLSLSAVEGGISNLTVEDQASGASSDVARSEPNCSRYRINHDLKLQSSYGHRLLPDGRPEVTTSHSRTSLTVDYILYSSDINATPSLPGGRGLQLLGRLSLVGQSELEEVHRLPNWHHSSDHLPLLVRFRLGPDSFT
ncbi:protein angel homolog 2 isoform X1 [Poecilia formosa]|uniref:protein angel homolog 2 isoform X1 n=2 Tax=Poecilia formosa TaxID=48698 RepID=UPI0007B8C388|nr:PREDICTED: protein angel homolog 2 isoform X1 [Poecilia formosa]